jgi:hypothetical protein
VLIFKVPFRNRRLVTELEADLPQKYNRLYWPYMDRVEREETGILFQILISVQLISHALQLVRRFNGSWLPLFSDATSTNCNQLTPRNRVLEYLILFHIVKKFPQLMEPEESFVHKTLPFVLILSQLNLDHTLPFQLLTTYFIVMFPSTLRCPNRSLSCRFLQQSLVFILLGVQHAPPISNALI